jgi:hypothetical protein
MVFTNQSPPIASLDYFTAIENKITDRLSPIEAEGIKVINLPTQPRIKMRGQALIYFTGVQDAEPTSIGIPVRSRLTYTIDAELYDPRDHKTIYPTIALIQSLLQSFQVYCGCVDAEGRLFRQSVSYQPRETDKGVSWIYSIAYAVDLTA